MANKGIVIIADYSQETPLTFKELCEVCHVPAEFMQHLIEYEIIHPSGEREEWQFDMVQLRRVKTAIRLYHDLEMNLVGVATVLDLMDELEDLRSRLMLSERHHW